MTDIVPPAVRDLLAFYAEGHPEARFGDLDIGALQCAVKSMEEAAKEVISAEEAAAQAREQFRGVEAEMAVKAGRILSFLKIHVEGDDVQLAQLEAISNAMPAARRKTKASGDATPSVGEPRERRPRKSKNSVAANELESEGTTPDLASNEPASKAAATE